jgi:hypothetical protein
VVPNGLTYADAVKLLGGSSPWVRAADNVHPSAGPAIGIVLRLLHADANRLPSADVRRLVGKIRAGEHFDDRSHLLTAVEILLADPAAAGADHRVLVEETLLGSAPLIAGRSAEGCLRLLTALSRAHPLSSADTLT